jgi:hypothetical protein
MYFGLMCSQPPTAEEYYKNDYPDEEDPDSDDGGTLFPHITPQSHLTIRADMFHDGSEAEDLDSDPASGSDHDWR